MDRKVFENVQRTRSSWFQKRKIAVVILSFSVFSLFTGAVICFCVHVFGENRLMFCSPGFCALSDAAPQVTTDFASKLIESAPVDGTTQSELIGPVPPGAGMLSSEEASAALTQEAKANKTFDVCNGTRCMYAPMDADKSSNCRVKSAKEPCPGTHQELVCTIHKKPVTR